MSDQPHDRVNADAGRADSATATGGADHPAPKATTRDVVAMLEDEGLEFERTPDPGGRAVAYVAAAVPLLLGLAALLIATRLSMGRLSNPGPGLWPAALSAALIVGALVIAFQAMRNGPDDTERFTSGVRHVVAGAVSLLSYGLLIDSIGFEIPTLITGLIWLRFIGRESWPKAVLTSVGAVVAVYLIFIMALKVTIPHWLPV